MCDETLRSRLPSLTALRFPAALIVLLFHVQMDLGVRDEFRFVTSLGYVGVTFFFILSGFVLAWTALPGDSTLDFWVRRFARIWPLHMATLIAFAALALGLQLEGQSLTGFILSTFLLQAWATSGELRYSFNAPSWTLSCEAFFYLAFPLLLRAAAARCHLRLLGATFVAMGVVTLATLMAADFVASQIGVRGSVVYGYILYNFPIYRIGEFAIGLFLALAIRAGWRVRIQVWWAAVLAVSVYSGLSIVAAVSFDGDLYDLPYGVAGWAMILPFALLIGAAACSDIQAGGLDKSGLRGPLLNALGRSSFALYLVHVPLMVCMARWIPDSDAEAWMRFAITIILSIIIAEFAHRYFEAPVERRLRNLASAPRRDESGWLGVDRLAARGPGAVRLGNGDGPTTDIAAQV